MSQSEPTETRPRTNDTFSRTVAGLGRLIEAVTPWLLDLGTWIFGALTAFNLVILGALLTVGPIDGAVKISTAAFALALPSDVAGFLLLRLIADMSKVGLAEVATKAFVDVGFSVEGAAQPDEAARRRVALRFSYALLALSVLLTVVGVTSALWHMAWWIGVGFVAMVVLTQALVLWAVSTLGPGGRWRTPAGEVEPKD